MEHCAASRDRTGHKVKLQRRDQMRNINFLLIELIYWGMVVWERQLSSNMSIKRNLTLKCLEEDEYLQLLNSHAFVGSLWVTRVIGGVLKDNLDERALGNSSRKQFIWPEFYRFHFKTELYGSTKTSTKLFCILLHVSIRSTIW
ncbi:hypothetical protein IEQ34_007161 [Dendrobium chrysotoxum]|uniref:Uncharacterized protein n=1 Tax=Dendrobium chrysotoxum TaxID=161865 RepID=A0AAV7HA39_DENCH|nr:hypothetical protein IEQ34_007161 [Dendrobium chrysotoxum]